MSISYELRYRPQGGDQEWSAWISTGTSTSHQLSGLDAGTEYEVEVRAVRTAGGVVVASVSNPAARRWTRFAKPPAPTVGAVLAETVSLSWNAVAGAAGYQVLRGGEPVAAQDVTFSETSGVVTAVVRGLTPGSSQTFSFAVLNADGDGSEPTEAPNPTTTVANLATGGTVENITVAGTAYRVHRFTSTGDSTFTLNAMRDVEYLIVGGGGGGGSRHGGGGGAGGMLTGTLSARAPGDYTITVGQGGAGRASSEGTNGGNSSAFDLTAIGGGRGGSGDNRGVASGGGSGGGSQSAGGGSDGTSGQGNSGGAGVGGANNNVWSGGGGGGAGAAGTAATGSPRSGGAGGNGRVSDITGESVMYAGGGGGSTDTTASGTAGRGGAGGGGAGAVLGWNFYNIKDIGLRWRVHDINGVAVSNGGSTTAAPATTAEFDYLITNSSISASGRADITNQNSGGTLSVNVLNWVTSLELETAMRATAGNSNSASPPNWTDGGDRHNNFAVVVEGKFVPKETGTYTFTLDSDDATDLFIDTNTSGAYSGSPVMSYYGGRGLQGLGNTGSGQANTVGTASLTAGTVYRFRVRQMERSGGEGLRLFWRKPSQGSNWFQDPEEMPGAFPQSGAEFSALLAGMSPGHGVGEINTQNATTNTKNILNWTTSAELQTALRTDPQRDTYTVPNSGNDFAVVVVGAFVPSEDGVYTFTVSGDDAVDVSLDGTVVVSHYGDHSAPDIGTRTGATASLTKGQTYRLQVRHQQRGGGSVLRVFWKKPSQSSGSVWYQDAVELATHGRNGEPNTGGGGGGGGYHSNTNRNGGAGGSGVVILRYRV